MQGFCLGDFRGGNSTPTLYDRMHCCLWGIVKLNDSKLNGLICTDKQNCIASYFLSVW